VAAPDTIVLRRHRDLEGRRHQQWVRRLLLAVIGALLVAGLANVFGQRPTTATGATDAATLSVYAPAHVRGGLLYMARFRVTAHRELEDAMLVLDQGWFEGLQVNTIEPSPVGEASRNGRVSFDLGHIPAGEHHTLYMEFQVDPTNVGRRSQGVELDDGDTTILRVHRTVTIFP
jgi:hypothetical protein